MHKIQTFHADPQHSVLHSAYLPTLPSELPHSHTFSTLYKC